MEGYVVEEWLGGEFTVGNLEGSRLSLFNKVRERDQSRKAAGILRYDENQEDEVREILSGFKILIAPEEQLRGLFANVQPKAAWSGGRRGTEKVLVYVQDMHSGTLQKRRKEGVSFCGGVAVKILGDGSSALNAMHAAGCPHGALCPENVFIQCSEDEARFLLGGVTEMHLNACLWRRGSKVTQTKLNAGLLPYLCPLLLRKVQAAKKKGEKVVLSENEEIAADVFALGIVVAECLF
uniref:Protein kinase domain-containing protein n=1 Tax=Chromera velia CCMP2878 TaxID=1169474 RepID=A0A0G4H419_9ALVE|eukprot:Cvel_24565.t1-p1 / transcript=Cvel_24565.t1 / gene=Cvel_24565 / organism=Chromera_velia_CCMP2878 / gene_product=hypothetical protein / transcript_product=hypothetical protein / location=Cvel_scaffold2672:19251-20644(+) / protein_length=236 / sequence_SO=supercontig / SO=protein_coding / is_pseudo=false